MCLCVHQGKSETGKALVFFQAPEAFGVVIAQQINQFADASWQQKSN